MSLLVNSPSFGCTSHIHRASGGILGLREVFDDASRLYVCAFPFAALKEVLDVKNYAVPACYVLAGSDTIYIGESNQADRRLIEHRGDSSKQFAREVFIVMAFNDSWADKVKPIYLQHRLTINAEAAGFVTVQRGVMPRTPDLPAWRLAPLARLGEDAERLLFDAGCRGFHSAYGQPRASERVMPEPLVLATAPVDHGPPDTTDSGAMEIGFAPALTRLAEEFELFYGDTVWARGYRAGDRFVVAAGSDIRTTLNPSASPIIRARREELEASGVLTAIPGIDDRKRLAVAVAFTSMAIAAKVVTGAHVDSSKWQPLSAQPIIMKL